ncbi:family 16 glycosylhydrolase [Paraglaciecola sp.]|uniref:family 16 glycosylhydrolase n=1 Tax=Paraglaciecola sp. TaxID=1920173 RepID=UPI0030F46B57
MNLTSTHLQKLTAVALAVGLFSCGGGSESNTKFDVVNPAEPVSDWVMVWSDEFEGSSIDKNKWSHEINCTGGGNNEQQCYGDSPENSFVSGGTLKIVAKPAAEGADLPYTSARLNTRYKADFKYGRFEMRAKLPSGQGSWPAFWMLPTDYVYGEWPKSGEIDILEAVNLKTVDAQGTVEAKVHGTLHYGQPWPDNKSSGKAYLLPDMANPADDFHTYAIEWQEGEIRWYVDDYLFATQMKSEVRYNSKGEALGLKHRGWFAEYFDLVTGKLTTHWDNAPFDQDFHLLLNLAVGGDWAGNVNNKGIDAAAFVDGQTYEIDFVRVYECSISPTYGNGCETIRRGYKEEASEENPTGALVIGEAPIPTPPSSGIAVPITIFADDVNLGWPLWDSNGGTTPTVEFDDAEHGAVAEFKIENNNGTVLGFNSRNGDPGVAFDASPMLTTGTLSFDMKVVSAPSTAGAVWLMKLESANNTTATGDVPLSSSVEGIAPVTGEWQTYTFTLQSLSDRGLDLGAIDVLMIFPAWATGEGAVYRVDNVKIQAAGASSRVISDFEGEADSYAFTDFDGGVATVVANPDMSGINTSAQVVKMEKFAGQPWGGTTLALGESIDLLGDTTFTMKVWSERAVPVLFKLEGAGGGLAEVSITHGGTGWEELTFDFAGIVDELTGITFIFDLGTMGDAAGDAANWTFYFDEIVIPGSGDEGSANSLSDFEGAADSYAFTDFDGGKATVVVNPDMSGINTSAQVAKMEKFAGQPWGGTTLALEDSIDLLGDTTFTLKVWSQRAVPVLFKLEGAGGGLAEVSIVHGGTGWEELTFDFAGVIDELTGITFIFDLGTMGDAAGDAANWTFYFDEISKK